MSFCIFGIGNSGSKVKQTAITNKQLKKAQEIILRNVHETLFSSASTIENFQSIVAKASGNVIIHDIDVKQYAELTSKTEFDVKNVLKSNDVIHEIFNEASKIALKSRSKGGLFGSTSKVITNTQNKVLTEIREKFKKTVKTKDSYKCVSTVLNTSKISAISGKNVIIYGVKIKQTAKMISNCAIKAMKNIISSIKVDEELISKLKSELFWLF